MDRKNYYGNDPLIEDESETPEGGILLPGHELDLHDEVDAALIGRPRRFVLDIYGIGCGED